MDISLRLEEISKMIKHKKVADIGTDHGYVPIYLVKNNKADHVIACDVNKGPLLKAEENIEKYHLGEKVETRLGSGFDPLQSGEAETIVIAGMGGMLIMDILKKGSEILKETKQLVLSPHSDVFYIRKYLHSIGFKIEDENIVFEDGKFYTIISAVQGSQIYEKEEEYVFGKINIEKKEPVFKRYLDEKLKNAQEVKNILLEASTEKSLLKAGETEYEILMCLEVLKTYEMQ